MDKKGIEMTMQTIVIAVLVLIILIVLLFIFGKYMGIYGNDMDLASRGDECPRGYPGCETGSQRAAYECGEDEMKLIGNFEAHRQGMVCCCTRK